MQIAIRDFSIMEEYASSVPMPCLTVYAAAMVLPAQLAQLHSLVPHAQLVQLDILVQAAQVASLDIILVLEYAAHVQSSVQDALPAQMLKPAPLALLAILDQPVSPVPQGFMPMELSAAPALMSIATAPFALL